MGLQGNLVLVDLGLRSEGLDERSLDRATATTRPRDGRGAGVWEGRGRGGAGVGRGEGRQAATRDAKRGAQAEGASRLESQPRCLPG